MPYTGMEELSFNTTQMKQIAQTVGAVIKEVVPPMINSAITASEKRLRKDIIDQAEAVKREIREEFNQKLEGMEKRLRKDIADFRVEVAERFSDTVYSRFDEHDRRLTRLEKKFT